MVSLPLVTQSTRSPLFRLPAETFNQILEEMLVADAPLLVEQVHGNNTQVAGIDPIFLRVCQQAYQVGHAMLYGRNIFCAEDPRPSLVFLARLPSSSVKAIRHIQFDLPLEDENATPAILYASGAFAHHVPSRSKFCINEYVS